MDWTPPKLLELSGGYWSACAVHAGVKLDLFSIIGARELPAHAVARHCHGDERGVAMLLDALTALGLLIKDATCYRNSDFSRTYLSKDAPAYLGHILLHHHHLMDAWSHLHQAVKSGRPLHDRVSHCDEAERRESFLMGMFNLASNLAPHLVPHIDLGDARRLLDLGGGPGTYAIHFCRHHPALTATIFDLPTTRPFAEATIARFDLQQRIAFCGGDYALDPVPTGYDVVWLSHILHGEGPEACRQLLEKAVQALVPGGLLLVHEFILDDNRAAPLFAALFSLNMLLATERGQAYSQGEIDTLLRDAGLTAIERLPLDIPGPSGVMAARRPL